LHAQQRRKYDFFFCVGVVYSGEYDVCDVTLSVYLHQASLKNMPASIPKVVGSIPTVAGHIFQARPVWIYTQSYITNIFKEKLALK
jgi:hypothetical protein